MKSFTQSITSFILAMSLSFLMGSCSQNPVDVKAEISEANNLLMAAYETGDAAELKTHYTSDARLLPQNGEAMNGPDAIAGFFGALKNMGIQKLKFETMSASAYGDFAVEEGVYTLYAPGDFVADHGKYLVTWKKENGTWKVHRDIWNTNNPPPVTRGMSGDTVMIVINKIKADKITQFEDYINNILKPAAEEYNQGARNTVRTQKSLRPDKDGSIDFIFIMDPMISGFDYDMNLPLTVKYGAEKAAEYGALYLECLAQKNTQVIIAQETGW